MTDTPKVTTSIGRCRLKGFLANMELAVYGGLPKETEVSRFCDVERESIALPCKIQLPLSCVKRSPGARTLE